MSLAVSLVTGHRSRPVARAGLLVRADASAGATLRNPETGSILSGSPFMHSLTATIALTFLAAGIGCGIGAETIESSNDVITALQ